MAAEKNKTNMYFLLKNKTTNNIYKKKRKRNNFVNDDLIDDFGGIFIQWQIVGFAGGRFAGSPSGVGHHFGQFRILARESVGSAGLVRLGVAQVDGHFVHQVVEQETFEIFAQHVQDKIIAKGYARNNHFGRVLN